MKYKTAYINLFKITIKKGPFIVIRTQNPEIIETD